MRNLKILFAVFMCLCGPLFGEEPERVEPLPIGNFSVPPTNQIAPLVSFGQLLIGKNALLPQLSGSYTRAHESYFNSIEPNVIYGIRDDLSVFFVVPFNPKSRSDSSHSSGIKDLILQLEYGYYSKAYRDYTLEASLVGNVQFPTGSKSKIPRNGNGSFTYFLGTTFAFLSQNWYAFVSPGANLTTARHGTRFGNSYLYEWGFARYIQALSPKGWIFDFMVEFNGVYAKKDKIKGSTDPDSGGNSIFLTPSIWMSSKHWVLQWGVGFPIVQNLNGKQDKIQYVLAYNVGYSFHF